MRISLFLFAFLLLAAPLVDGQTFTLDLQAETVIADASATIADVSVGLVCDQSIDVIGFSLYFSFDPEMFHITGIASDLPITPSFFSGEYLNDPYTNPFSGEVTPEGVGLVGCVFDFGLIGTIETVPGVVVPAIRITGFGGPVASGGDVSEIVFENGLAIPTQGTSTNGVAWLLTPAQPFEAPIDLSSGASVSLDFAALPQFARGDANGDGSIAIVDAIETLQYLFLGGSPGPCLASHDSDADGGVAIVDPLFVLTYLFLGGAAPNPFGCLDQDPLDVDCASSVCP